MRNLASPARLLNSAKWRDLGDISKGALATTEPRSIRGGVIPLAFANHGRRIVRLEPLKP